MYILAHKFSESETYYVRDNDNGTYDEVFFPECATEFSSKDSAISWSLENTTFSEYAVALEKDDEIKRYYSMPVRRHFVKVNNKISRKYNSEDAMGVFDWWISIRNRDYEIRFEDYKTWPELSIMFSHLFRQQAYEVNGEPKYTFSIRTSRDGNFKTFEREFKLALQYCEYIEDDFFIFDVFDHYLSEDGGVMLYYNTDDDCIIQGRYRILCEGTFEQCFEFIKKERWYE